MRVAHIDSIIGLWCLGLIDLIDAVVINPPLAFSIDPKASPHLSIGRRVLALAMLLASAPRALELSAIRPVKCAFSFVFVIDMVANVLAAIEPLKYAIAVHFVFLPVTSILAAVRPDVATLTMYLIIMEDALITAAIGPLEVPFTVLLALLVMA